MEFGERLKKAREEKGMTQQTLADQIYVTRQAVSKWERGERYPDLMTTKFIASILGVSIDSLVSDDELKTYTEKQAYNYRQREGKVMTAMYSLVAILSIVALIPMITNLLFALFSKSAQTSTQIPITSYLMEGCEVVKYFVLAIMGIGFAIASVRKVIDGKFAAYIGISYFFFAVVRRIINISIIPSIDGNRKGLILGVVVSGLFLGLFIYFSWKYFISKNIRYAKIVIGFGIVEIAYSIFTLGTSIVQLIRYSEETIIALSVPEMVYSMIIKVVVLLMMLVQIIIIERRRKAA